MAGEDSDSERAARTARGVRQILIGIVFGAAGALITWYTFKQVAKSGGTYFIAYGPMIYGAVAIARGIYIISTVGRERTDRLERRGPEPGRVIAVQGFGFTTFVALRYLMARNHRVSQFLLILLIVAVALAVGGFAIEHLLMTRSNPLKLEPEMMMAAARAVTGVKIAGFVLVFITIIVGVLRYFFSFFTTVPLVGVWIGTGALVCVLSVMSGFESDLRQKILGSNAHIQVTREDGDFTGWHEIKARIDKIPGVLASTPYAVSEVVIAANSNGMNVIIKGIDPDSVGTVTDLVSDLEDRDAMKRLAPLVDDQYDLRVPVTPNHTKGTRDPAPADMPTGGDPIDFSQPAPDSGSDTTTGTDTWPGTGPATGSGSATATGSGSASGSGSEYLVGEQNIVDRAPSDLLSSDELPIDYSGSDGSVDPTIHVVDIPFDQPGLSRRTQALHGILVGRELVKQTHLYTGEEVRIVSPLSDPANPDANGTPIPYNRDYRVAGIFFTGMYEYDLKYVYVTLDSLQAFLGRGDEIDGIEIRVSSPDETGQYVRLISDMLGPHYRVQDWNELNHSLFTALKLEKIAMFIVLGIVILVASFSIVGNLIMVVVEKQREIALLKTLGASDNSLMRVFAIQGLLIGLLGTALGVATGLAACWAGKTYGIPLNPDVYYIDRMPVHVETNSVLVTAAAGILISMAATFYPAFLASRVRPAAGMRH